MIALLWFALAILALPFKSKNRLEAENAALKRRLIALRRNVHGRIGLCVPKNRAALRFGSGRAASPICQDVIFGSDRDTKPVGSEFFLMARLRAAIALESAGSLVG